MIDANAVSRVVGIETNFVNLRKGNSVNLPQRIAVFGPGNDTNTFSTLKRQVFTELEAGTIYGFGSPIHNAVKQLLPNNGKGVGTIPVTVYPVPPTGGATFATYTITVSTQPSNDPGTYVVNVGGVLSDVVDPASGDDETAAAAKIVTAINNVANMPVIAANTAGVVTLTCKFKGTAGNNIKVSVDRSDDATNTIVVAAGVTATGDGDAASVLTQMGNVWETLIVNCLTASTTQLDAYQTFNELRWAATISKPHIVFSGSNESSVSTAITVPDARRTDRTNVQLSSPGSSDLEYVIAAAQVREIALIASESPARDYGSVSVAGLTPGADSAQWGYLNRETAVKGGVSTVKVQDGVVTLGDTVTFYHPTNDPTPAYRYVCDIIKIMHINFNLALIFVTPEWDGAPLLPDNQVVTDPSAKQPKHAKAEIASLIDSLGRGAIISDPSTAKGSITASIDSGNPKRLNVSFTTQLSGNSNIIDITHNFGFYFGN